jgi:16S rRNA (cytosine967-C5)-methyltransferase
LANAREIAVLTLVACEKQGAWSDGHLKKAIKQNGLDRRDAALATRLCFGVLQNRYLLDFYLSHFSSHILS